MSVLSEEESVYLEQMKELDIKRKGDWIGVIAGVALIIVGLADYVTGMSIFGANFLLFVVVGAIGCIYCIIRVAYHSRKYSTLKKDLDKISNRDKAQIG